MVNPGYYGDPKGIRIQPDQAYPRPRESSAEMIAGISKTTARTPSVHSWLSLRLASLIASLGVCLANSAAGGDRRE